MSSGAVLISTGAMTSAEVLISEGAITSAEVLISKGAITSAAVRILYFVLDAGVGLGLGVGEGASGLFTLGIRAGVDVEASEIADVVAVRTSIAAIAR